jgi:hypothetical protein
VPVVVTVTVTGVGVEPLRTAELGDTEQLDPDGAPPQLSNTVWLNPPSGTTETV